MKDALSSLDIHLLVRELQSVVGARLDKAYQGSKEEKRDLTLQFHKTGEGKLLLRILLPGLLHLSSEKSEYPKMPGQFAVFLRKHVGNARLVAVRQRGFERIVELELENKDGRFLLLLELLPPGNALLLNRDGKIINLLEPQRHGQRLLRGGAVYEAPPPGFDTASASEEGIVERLVTSGKESIVKSLAIDLGLGGDYAEEACVRAGVEKGSGALSRERLVAVATAVRSLFSEPIAARSTDDGIFPFAMETKGAVASFPSFSAAIEATAVPAPARTTAEATVRRTKKEKAVEVIRVQELQLAGYLKSAEENQRKGELLFEHYQEVRALLEEISAARKASSWAELKGRLGGRVVSIDERKGEVTIDLDEGG